MAQFRTEDVAFSHVGDLPIVKRYTNEFNLVDSINTMVKRQMDLSPGLAVLAMVLNTLSGTTRLCRLKEFFQDKHTELLGGSDIESE